MKKFVIFVFGMLTLGLMLPAVAATSKECICKCKATSQSFFSARPLYQTASPEKESLNRNRMTLREEGHAGSLQLTLFGSRSTDRDKLARYFTPFCKNVLTVTNNVFDPENPPDLIAQHFNIYTALTGTEPRKPLPFKSEICIAPYQTAIGLGITWRQGFWHNECNDRWFWFELSTPIERVQNHVCLTEKVDPSSTDEFLDNDLPHNMIQAFKQKAWRYGKIDDKCCMTKSGLADVELKLGYEWLKNDCCFFESYIGVLAPAGNRPVACYLFEPIVGHNKHWGMMIGGSGLFELWHNDECTWEVNYAMDLYSLYLFSGCERRSFDLKYRPWSRYMQLYLNKEQAQEAADLYASGKGTEAILLSTPGINVFTRDLTVEPRLTTVVNSALCFNHCAWQGEIGYNYFCREAECVSLRNCWQQGPALKSIFYNLDPTAAVPGVTNDLQTISLEILSTVPVQPKALADYDDNLITADMLDLESAAHPAVSTNTFYGTLGYHWECCREYPSFVAVGGSYEYSEINTGLNRWVAWVKGGFSY